jgi:hypothetical protein
MVFLGFHGELGDNVESLTTIPAAMYWVECQE